MWQRAAEQTKEDGGLVPREAHSETARGTRPLEETGGTDVLRRNIWIFKVSILSGPHPGRGLAETGQYISDAPSQ